MGKIKLFCLPYAGGSATIYRKWKEHLHPQIECVPIELAGRGLRFSEPLYTSWHQAIEDLFDRVKPYLDGSPVALFGYSMGSMLAFELAHKVKDWTGRDPQHVFLAARSAPDRQRKRRSIHHLPDAEFLDEVMKMGGTPDEIKKHKDLLHLFLPILRADFTIIETYECFPKETKLNCNFTVLGGAKDNIHNEDLMAWNAYTDGHTSLYQLDGDHFFIHHNMDQMIHLIHQKILKRRA